MTNNEYIFSYKSRDLNRPNVILYGMEELQLLKVEVEVLQEVNISNERYNFIESIKNIDEKDLTEDIIKERDRIIPEDFCVYYKIYPHTTIMYDNLSCFLNEHTEISNDFNKFEEFKKDIHLLETLDEYLLNNISETGNLTYQDMIQYHVKLKEMIENVFNVISERYGLEYTGKNDNWDIPEPQNQIEEFMKTLIEKTK